MQSIYRYLLAAVAAVAMSPFLGAAPAAASLPVAVDDSYYVKVDGSLLVPSPGLLANDKELTSGLKVKTLSPLPLGLTVYDTGNFTFNASSLPVTHQFKYCIVVSDSCSSNEATATLHVVAEPEPADDTYATPFSTYLEVPAPGVLSNDGTVPPGAKVGWLGVVSGFTGSSDGGFSYQPGLSTTPVKIAYCILNQSIPPTCMSDEATLSITVGPAPEAVDDEYPIPVNATLALPAPGVLENDKNVPPGSTVSWQTALPAGVTLHENGALDYTPAPDFIGSVSFDYCIRDKSIPPGCLSTATVTLTTTPLPTPPSLVDDAYTMVAGQTLTVAEPGVLANDGGVPASGLLRLVEPDESVTLASDGSFTYVPGDGFTGTHQFKYCVTLIEGGLCLGEPATVTITVLPASGGDGGGSLPITGPDVTWLALAGLTLVLAGAGVFLLMRRRAGLN